MAERDEPTGALVRPYAVTRGRTRPKLEIAIEELVETTVRGRAANSRPGGNHVQEQQYISTLCDGRLQSLAEIAADSLPGGASFIYCPVKCFHRSSPLWAPTLPAVGGHAHRPPPSDSCRKWPTW